MRDRIADELPWWRLADVPARSATPHRRVAFVLLAAVLAILVATSSYLVSLRIAAQRATVARLDRMAAARAADVATLRQDFEIRSRMSELDRWGTEMRLGAPRADQYAADGRSLAATADGRRRELDAADVAEGRAALDAPKPAYPAAARERLDTLIDRIVP